jgi:hypothetical protein
MILCHMHQNGASAVARSFKKMNEKSFSLLLRLLLSYCIFVSKAPLVFASWTNCRFVKRRWKNHEKCEILFFNYSDPTFHDLDQTTYFLCSVMSCFPSSKKSTMGTSCRHCVANQWVPSGDSTTLGQISLRGADAELSHWLHRLAQFQNLSSG